MADLTAIPASDLRALKERIAARRCHDPLTARDVEAVHLLEGVPCAEAERVLDAVLFERDKQPAPPQLVWTGPGPVHAAVRDTAVTLAQLFGRARRRVIVAGYSFDHGHDIFAPLHRVMVEHEVTADFFVNIAIKDHERAQLATEEGQHALVTKRVAEFLAQNWPGAPFPTIHYDDRPVTTTVFASLHAKCVVVDDAEALVTSANFTNRGQERNVEVGALIRDARFAGALAAQWHNARLQGMFVTYEG